MQIFCFFIFFLLLNIAAYFSLFIDIFHLFDWLELVPVSFFDKKHRTKTIIIFFTIWLNDSMFFITIAHSHQNTDSSHRITDSSVLSQNHRQFSQSHRQFILFLDSLPIYRQFSSVFESFFVTLESKKNS